MLIAHAAVGRAVSSGEKLASLDFGQLDQRGTGQIELVFDGIHKTTNSLEIRLLLSSGSGKPTVAGSLFTYGEGSHSSQDDTGRFAPMKMSMDVTAAARQLAGSSQVDVRVQLLDSNGREVKEPLILDKLELHQH
jgi:hypothetical protein